MAHIPTVLCSALLTALALASLGTRSQAQDVLDDAPPIVARPLNERPSPAALPVVSAGGVRLADPAPAPESALMTPAAGSAAMTEGSRAALGASSGSGAPSAASDDDEVVGGHPHATHALVVSAERPMALAWDAQRHAGAVAVHGHVLIIEELRDHAGQPAGALGLFASVPLAGVGHLSLAPDAGLVYASSARAAILHAVSLADGTERAAFPAGGPRPGVLFYHPALHRLASFNAGATTLTLFDTASQAFEGLIPLGDAPVAARLAPDGRVLVLLPERRELTLLGLRPLRIFSRWALPGECQHPQDLDVDPAGLRVFIACGTPDIPVFNLRDSDWAASLVGTPAGGEVSRVFWDGPRKRLLAVADDGSVAEAAVDGAGATVLANVPAGSRLAHDPAGNRLVVAAPEESSGLRLSFVPLK